MKSQKLTLAKTVSRAWHQIDASTAPMGRIATSIATLLRGNHKRDFTPNMDMGDFVVAINTGKLKFTGRKTEQKKYYRHSCYLGCIKHETLKTVLEKHPSEALKRAVFSMIDDIKFRKKIMSRLKLVEGTEHGYKIDKS